ncbi:MAG: hypothetical protein Q8O27_00755 [Enterobacteriaceae bacterium]|nr:hypothetical protein [Enterobacteriaceae bacterium]
MPKEKTDWREILFYKGGHYLGEKERVRLDIDQIELEKFIEYLLKEAKEEILKECIELSDKIEGEAINTEFNEWRAFKGFRNALRDKLKK